MARPNRNEIPGMHHGSRGEPVSVPGRNFFNECEAHNNYSSIFRKREQLPVLPPSRDVNFGLSNLCAITILAQAPKRPFARSALYRIQTLRRQLSSQFARPAL